MAINVDISKITGINQVGNSYQRKSAVPLDYYSYFNTKAEAEAYAASNPVSYVGQIIAYSHEGKVVTCVIADAAGTLREIEKPIAGQLISVGADNSVNHAEIDEAPWAKYIRPSQSDENRWDIGRQNIIKVEALNSEGEYIDITDSVRWEVIDPDIGEEAFIIRNNVTDWDDPRVLVEDNGSHGFIADLLFDGHGHVIGKFGGKLPEQKIYTGDNKTIAIEQDGTIRLVGASEENPPEGGQILSWDSSSDQVQWIDPVEDTDTNTTYSFEFDKTEQKIKIAVSTTEKGEVTNSNTEELDLSDFLTADELPEDKDTTYSVKEGEKVLSLSGTEFSTDISLVHENGKIQLLGKPQVDENGAIITDEEGKTVYEVISEFSDADFIKDGFLTEATLVDENPNLEGEDKTIGGPFLKLTWNTDSNKTTTYVPIGSLVDVYTAGNGLKLEDKEFSIQIATDSENFLSVDSNGLKLSGVQDAIDTAKQEAIDAAAEAASKYDSKAEASSVYTKEETNNLLNAKANAADVYTKSEADGLLNAKANSDDVARTYATKEYVGTIPSTYTENNIVAYINKKAEETLSAAQGGSSETAASVKQQLDNYKSENLAKFEKLDGIEASAEVNIIETVKVNDQQLTPDSNRAVNITVPTKLSDLADDITHVKVVKMKEAVADGYQPKLIVSQVENNVTIDDSALQADIADVKSVADTAVQSAEFAGEALVKTGTKVSITKEKAIEALGLKSLAFTESIDTGVHAVSLASGTNNGTVKLTVDSNVTDNIAVTGLKSAAYEDKSAFAPAGDYKTKQTAKSGTLTGAQVVSTWAQDANGEVAITTRDLTPADIGAQPVGNYKTTQTAVVDPTATKLDVTKGATISYIDTVAQNENGEITATKKSFDVAAYIEHRLGDITDIMNFRGVITPTANGFDADIAAITTPQKGDIVLYGEYEYIYDGAKWVVFGDATGIIASAKSYTDGKFNEAKAYTDGKFDEAKHYTDGKFNTAKEYTDAEIAKIHGVDDASIKLNENNKAYVAAVSTDLLFNGELELIFCAGGAQ